MKRNWELKIRGEIIEKVVIKRFYDGTYQIDTGHVSTMKFYKTYNACEKYLIKNGYTPVEG